MLLIRGTAEPQQGRFEPPTVAKLAPELLLSISGASQRGFCISWLVLVMLSGCTILQGPAAQQRRLKVVHCEAAACK